MVQPQAQVGYPNLVSIICLGTRPATDPWHNHYKYYIQTSAPSDTDRYQTRGVASRSCKPFDTFTSTQSNNSTRHTGKILLDHCLSKDIPTSRAIWLAKCVGANEIRAFKRKGTGVFTVGGEAKWIKDWTINVEQFLESIIGICGSTEWRAKINYGFVLLHHTARDVG